jgi:GntR family transcriptional regulator, transcriptional repressor for pyruvate dehydrogenase complex
VRKVSVQSAARETADILREEILARVASTDSYVLGSEDEVGSLLGVSRPTLRQALRMLEQEQLVVVRRGVGGGLFGRRPTETGVTQMASVFLRSRGTTYRDLVHTLSLLCTRAATLAAANPDPAARALVGDHYAERLPDGLHDGVDVAEFVDHAGQFDVLLARVSGNPALHLFVGVLIELARPAATAAVYDDEAMRATLAGHLGVAEAVVAGNGRLASSRMKRHLSSALHWLDQDLPLQALYPDTDVETRPPRQP